MAGTAGQAVAFHDGVQIVAREFGKQAPRQLHGAEHRRRERQARLGEFAAQERVVEARVVRHERRPLELAAHGAGDLGETRRIGHHGVADAREGLDVRGYGRSGLTSELHSSSSSPPATRTMPISVIRSYAALPPVVSKSTNTRSSGRSSAAAIERQQGVVQIGTPIAGTLPRTAGSGAPHPDRRRRSARPRWCGPPRPPSRRCARR